MGGRVDDAAGPWQPLLAVPWRVPLSRLPWRSAAYLLSGPPVALAWAAGTVVLLALGAVTAPLVVGVWVLGRVPAWTVAMGRVERARLRLLDRRPVPPIPRGDRARELLTEPTTWREVGHGLLLCVLAPIDLGCLLVVAATVLGPLSAPVWHALPGSPRANASWQAVVDDPALAWAAAGGGLVIAVAASYLVSAVAAAQAVLARTLLVPSEDRDLRLRLIEVDRSRARLVDVFDSERRRLERDLHDGTQQRLTGLIMTLGLAKLELGDAAPEAGSLVERAYREAQETLGELQDLVRGMRPAILGDRGLPTALAEAARRCPVPVTVRAAAAGPRPPEAVEAALYFAGCETLTNLAKHSGAGRAELDLAGEPSGPGRRRLVLRVEDDGAGGADPERGSGLTGVADRIAALGGSVSLSSPPGGPTVIRVEVEWTS
ncbi:sensor histidine kinase [Microtetraspora fusca]|uniref:histidine kinase n=1 Tax=Microtetraspora fusca TaxID=1997 RepID=A0ABW6V8Q6_MICFU|nr:sensor histidine kinase [Microtetraspora fusca]